MALTPATAGIHTEWVGGRLPERLFDRLPEILDRASMFGWGTGRGGDRRTARRVPTGRVGQGAGFCFTGRIWRAATIERRQQRVNEQIRAASVRAIDADGTQLGIINTSDALAKAHDANLDLVEVAPLENPPVCRIMDYGKFKYQQRKRQNKSHAHQSRNKEIRLRPKIGKHDFDFKVNRARGFLRDKNKVVFSVVFRGRENAHVNEGFKLVENVIQELDDVGKVEQNPGMQGRRLVLIMAPK